MGTPPPPDDWDDLSEVSRQALAVPLPSQRKFFAKLARAHQARDSVPPPMPRWLWHMVAGLLVVLIAGGGSVAGATFLQARDTATAVRTHEQYGHRDVSEVLNKLDRRLGRIEARLDAMERERPGDR